MSTSDSSSLDSPLSVLIIRFSSFGDVILATSVLNQEALKRKIIKNKYNTLLVDWLVSKEYRDLLVDHPQLRVVHGFDRKTGIRGLIQLSKLLAEADYDVVLDLHQTARVYLLRIFYFIQKLYLRKGTSTEWMTVRKPRWRTWGLFCFKGFWSKRFNPPSVLSRIANFLNVDRVITDLTYIKNPILRARLLPVQKNYYIVMPSSLWEGKCWETQNYVNVITMLSKQISWIPVIVGTEKDRLSKKLVEHLKKNKIEHFDSVGKWTQKELAVVVGDSQFYLGSDTGISHLSEALNVPALVLFGPTSPSVGFGPWLRQSVSIEASVFCRPCGKDGRRCYRVFNPYLCMREITPSQVVYEVTKLVTQLGIEKC